MKEGVTYGFELLLWRFGGQKQLGRGREPGAPASSLRSRGRGEAGPRRRASSVQGGAAGVGQRGEAQGAGASAAPSEGRRPALQRARGGRLAATGADRDVRAEGRRRIRLGRHSLSWAGSPF